ncbi:C40 family peptidase [Desulfovibrio sp. OttesenSCG-928-A18]|nr:C40 family peptidase [Desulfovibrio sp. OttesenSCG-928-A18]
MRMVKMLVVICAFFCCTACSLRSSSDQGSVTGTAVSKTALSMVGTRYKYGGASPSKGFDCSGLVSWAYAQHGLSLPRTAKAQSRSGKSVKKSNLQPGDVVVFKTRNGMHTGIYTGRGRFVHSPSTGKKVCEESLGARFWTEHFVSGRRHTALN